MDPERPVVGVLLEQTLGHVSHGRNLQRSLSNSDKARLSWKELPFEPNGIRDRLPPRSNWTVRSGLTARGAVRELQSEGPIDALLVHTHVPATLLGSVMDTVPTVISIDATPHQIDTLGTSYNHPVQSPVVETIKRRVHTTSFRRAASLITWSKWAADSLVADYGIDRDRIAVIPPGVVTSQWRRTDRAVESGETTRILFVGGDFERKGGDLLLAAVARLNADPELNARGHTVQLELVTTAAVDESAHVNVHRSLTPNSAGLIELFHRCDIFALPTRGDCTPMVLAEAAASGLPTVATAVGAIPETVIDGSTGHLVDPNVESLTAALRKLVVDREHRRRLGDNAAEHAVRTMNATTNAQRLLDQVIEHVRPRPSTGRVLLTVSGHIAPDIDHAIADGERPLADYKAISAATGATLLDRSRLANEITGPTSLLRAIAGQDIAMAYHVFRHRRHLDVIVTDGEQVGLPLAAMLRFAGRRGVRHIMIGHRLSPAKKALPTRLLGLAGGVDEVLVYCTSQLHVAQSLFRQPGQRVRLIDFMVDTEFFRPSNNSTRDLTGPPVLCTAGREYRDYPTLIEAVRDLDVDVVIASASPWSKRADNANVDDLPGNVTVTSLTQQELRDQLESSDLVVMPLAPVDFQAGVTTILEAMAMAKPVICTATPGQIDVVVDGATGRYVPPGDVAAMRQAIQALLDDPLLAAEMGRQGRALVEERADVERYAAIFGEVVQRHLAVAERQRTRQVLAS